MSQLKDTAMDQSRSRPASMLETARHAAAEQSGEAPSKAARQTAWAKAGLLAMATAAAVLLAAAPAAAQVQEMDATGRADGVARISERPPELDRQFRRAQMAWRQGASLLEAKARLDQVLRELPDDLEARKLRAEVLLEMGRPGEALADAAHAADLRPHDGMAQLLRAEAARKDSQLAEARRALDRSADHLPEQAPPHTRFSWNAMHLGRLAQAEAFARVALALDSTSAPAYRQLAQVFLKRDRADEAASVLARGLRAGVLESRTIREDDMLRQVVGHRRLQRLMRR